MPGSRVPDAGDIVWMAFSPQTGREQAGRRPTLLRPEPVEVWQPVLAVGHGLAVESDVIDVERR